jgi:hypothetical protein
MKIKNTNNKIFKTVKNYHKKKNPKIALKNLPRIERRRRLQESQQREVSKRKFSIHISKQRFLSLHGRFLHVHSLLP